jgi:hypothetical protein
LAIEKQIIIPTSYLMLSDSLKSIQHQLYITKNDLIIHLKYQKIEIEETKELQNMLSTLHNLGHILHYSHLEDCENYIILKPQWLIDVFKSVVTTRNNSVINRGWLYHNNLSILWPKYENNLHQFLLQLLHKFNIAIDSNVRSLIPCRLENGLPNSILEDFNGKLLRKIEFPHILPLDLFPIVIASPQLFLFLQDLKSHEIIWKDASLLSKGKILIKCFETQIHIFGETNEDYIIDIIGQFTLVIQQTIRNRYSGIFENVTINCFQD